VAEAFFKKYNKNKKIEVKSAGIAIDILRPYMCKNVKDILEEKGIKMIGTEQLHSLSPEIQMKNGFCDEQSREINEQDIKWADKIIVVSNNVDYSIFPKEKLEVWEIEDAGESEKEKIREIIEKIEKRIKGLIKKDDAL